MTIPERVAAIQAEFEGYDRPLDSKVRNPKKYGVILTPRARQLVGEQTTRNKGLLNLSARIPTEFINAELFRRMLASCGYASQKAWIMACYKRLEAEYAARQKKSRPTAAKRITQ